MTLKKNILQKLSIILITTTVAIALSFGLKILFRFSYNPNVLSWIFIIIFTAPNFLLLCEHTIQTFRQGITIGKDQNLYKDGKLLYTQEQIAQIEHIIQYNHIQAPPILNFHFYILKLQNRKEIKISTLALNAPITISTKLVERKVYIPSITNINSQEQESMVKPISFYLSKFSNKSTGELKDIISKSDIYQSEAIEAAKQLLKKATNT